MFKGDQRTETGAVQSRAAPRATPSTVSFFKNKTPGNASVGRPIGAARLALSATPLVGAYAATLAANDGSTDAGGFTAFVLLACIRIWIKFVHRRSKHLVPLHDRLTIW